MMMEEAACDCWNRHRHPATVTLRTVTHRSIISKKEKHRHPARTLHSKQQEEAKWGVMLTPLAKLECGLNGCLDFARETHKAVIMKAKPVRM